MKRNNNLTEKEINIIEKGVEIIHSDLNAINDLIEGFDKSNIISLYANPYTGKTLLALQESYYLAKKTGKNVLYIETEGGTNRFISRWDSKLKQKYNIKKEETPIILQCKREILDLLEFHGIKLTIDITKKGKTTVIKLEEAKVMPIEKIIQKENIGVIIYDSFTEPFRAFGSASQGLPARSDTVGYLFEAILKLIDKYHLTVITLNHASLNPTNPFAPAEMRGGSVIRYLSKIILYLESFRGVKLANYRKLHIIRYPDKAAWSQTTYLKYTDDGIRDANIDEIKEITSRKKSKTGEITVEDESNT